MKMSWFLVSAFACTYILCAAGFNIDTHSTFVKFGDSNSEFGFSLLGHILNDGSRGIIVGSPKSGFNGEIKWCTLFESSCSDVNVDLAEIARTNSQISDALFGYCLASLNSSSPSKVTVCAPRLTRSSLSVVYVTGGCFELDANLQNPTVNSMSVSICQDDPAAAESLSVRHCTMGATVGYHSRAPDDVFMGGPYFHFSKGMGAIVDTKRFTHEHTSLNGLLRNTLVGSSLDISDRIFAPRPGHAQPVHVAYGGPGVPAEDDVSDNIGTGLVLIYPNFKESHTLSIQPVVRLTGNQFGSRFGHALILVDVNKDGWEDLIVGAPFQELEAMAGSQPEYGAVFVFINQQNTFRYPVHDLDGQSPFTYKGDEAYQILTPSGLHDECGSSRISGYGSTLAAIGDVNHDGYEDFAVGAPYAEGGGIVFIYHGSRTGHISLPSQVICTAKLSTTTLMEGFGFSIGLQGLDLDNNGYPDLAIGSPLSDSVLVLRTRPVIKFDAHLTLEDGSTVLPTNLDSLPECTSAISAIPGYKAPNVHCANVKLFMTYSSIDGYSCIPNKLFRVSVLLKMDPVDSWIHELLKADKKFDGSVSSNSELEENYNVCGVEDNSTHAIQNGIHSVFSKYLVAPISFVGEIEVAEFGSRAHEFFSLNKSAHLAALETPGGYLKVDVDATCRETSVASLTAKPAPAELLHAADLRLVIRDTKIVDQTQPISIGIRWIASLPNPSRNAADINQFPTTDPRDNSRLLQLTTDNPCMKRRCCTDIRVVFSTDITRDKSGPVVYVGDDKEQIIIIRVRVTNIGIDPTYNMNLVSSYPSNFLELDESDLTGADITQGAAICHLANPLLPGRSAECSLKWHVVGHELSVHLAQFTLNSTVVTGSAAHVRVEGLLTNQLQVNIKMVANVTVEGTVDPNTVYFSGNVSDGISSMTAENQIGDSRLLLRFTIQNLRKHSLIPVSRIVIDWPYEIAGDVSDHHGKYMLYLLEIPSVIQRQLAVPQGSSSVKTSVVCDSRVLEKIVNPHRFRVFPFLKPSKDSVSARLGPVDLPATHTSGYPPLSSSPKLEDLYDRLNDTKLTSKRKMTTLSCYNGQLRCVPIVCDLGKLSYKAGPITLELIARLWDNTMREDFKDVFLTKLHISATWRADVKYEIDLGDSDHAMNTVELSIFNNLEPKPIVPKYMFLYISLAVFGGVLLLAVIIIILKQTGFFKRKRFIRRPRRGIKDEIKGTPAQELPVQSSGKQPNRRNPDVIHLTRSRVLQSSKNTVPTVFTSTTPRKRKCVGFQHL